MIDLFSEDARRNPYPVYDQMRDQSPVLEIPPLDVWMIFDYEGVKRALNDHEDFSSNVPAPRWLVFTDPPRHTKLRALISKGFTSRVVENLEPRIRELSCGLLDPVMDRGEMDLAADYSAPLPMMVIAELIGIPVEDRPRYQYWSEVILKISLGLVGGEEAEQAMIQFSAVTVEMNDYLTTMIEQRRSTPRDDLLTKLISAEVDGERLTQDEILSFFQVLLVAGQETTTNTINNAMLCFMENPDQLDRLRADPGLMPSAIEEVLRYRSPFQWTLRAARREVTMNGQRIPAGKRVLPVIGSANRDPRQFVNADRFDISRAPNPHLAFGHGIHFCLGAPLARLEARIALWDLLDRMESFALASDEPWEPRRALHVHGPSRLPICFEPVSSGHGV